MAELRDAASDVVYRPLSGLALGGFALSCLFGGVVALSAGIAIFQGAPFFFPNWILFLAAAGFVVSWWGSSDVKNSEGTKAGQKLASYGMWISLVTGAGYFAYSYFTGLALSQQAMTFLLGEDDGFFTHLRKAAKDGDVEINRAFLLSLPPSDRGKINPADSKEMALAFDRPGKEEGPGNLSRFRMDHLVASVSRGSGDVTIEPMGVHAWKYEQRSYHVTCLFRIQTQEAKAELAVTARSAEPESEGQGRQWFVDMTTVNHRSLVRTPFGEGMSRLRSHAISFAQSLETTLRKSGGKPGDFARLDKTDWSRFEPAAQQELQPRLKEIWDGNDLLMTWHFQATKEDSLTDWDFDDQGRLTLHLPLFLMLSDAKQHFRNAGEQTLALQSKAAVRPEQIGSAVSFEWPDWELKQFKVTRVNPGGRK